MITTVRNAPGRNSHGAYLPKSLRAARAAGTRTAPRECVTIAICPHKAAQMIHLPCRTKNGRNHSSLTRVNAPPALVINGRPDAMKGTCRAPLEDQSDGAAA